MILPGQSNEDSLFREPRDSPMSRSRTDSDVPDTMLRSDRRESAVDETSATVDLAVSVIIPALNETRRLPPYLTAIQSHCQSQFADRYEVVVVDDGSTDGLPDVLQELSQDMPQLKVISHGQNRGKGAAVRTGMLAGLGDLLLFADADGATPIEEETRLRSAIEAGADLAVGSRLVEASNVRRRRTKGRAMIGRGFASLVRWFLNIPVRDTQCGFKMIRREPARELFTVMREEGFLFDLELLILARRLGYRIVEVPVNWSDQPESRMKWFPVLRQMLSVLPRLRRIGRGVPASCGKQ